MLSTNAILKGKVWFRGVPWISGIGGRSCRLLICTQVLLTTGKALGKDLLVI